MFPETIACLFTGLIPPMERHCVIRGATTSDTLWAVGAHPFGGATRSNVFSQILLDSVHRNILLGSVHRSLTAAVTTQQATSATI